MTYYSNLTRAAVALLLSITGTVAGAQAVGTAEAATGSNAGTSTPIQEIVVTGTLIPVTPDSIAVSVTTMDSEDLSQIGVTNSTLELLRKAIPAFAGRSNAGTSNAQNHNQFTAGGSQIALRNLPTLVLVNGQRLALHAVAGLSGSKNFVDVGQIPAAALDHIDVLSDGASSLYGADAVGGVVNFILKHDYQGLQFGTRYGRADGGYDERSAFLTGGMDFGPANITATLSYSKSTPLWQYSRSFASPMYGVVPGTGIPGVVDGGNYILAPGLTTPPPPTGTSATAASYTELAANGVYDPTNATDLSNGFDYSQYAMLLQQEEHTSFVANVTSDNLFGSSVAAFGDIIISRNKVQSTAWQATGKPFAYTSVTVPAGAPYDPLTTDAAGVTFADSANVKGVYDTTDAFRVSAGLEGDFAADWTWQTSVTYSESKLTENNTNLLFGPNVAPAIAGGYDASGNAVAGGENSMVYDGYSIDNPMVLQPALNPFASTGNSAAALANVFGTEVLSGNSKLYSWDGHAVGSVFSLPAGPVSLAVGLNWRREEVSGHADPNGRVTDPVTGSTAGNAQNWIGGLYTDPFSHSRSDSAVYAETRIPLTSSDMNVPVLSELELTAAARYERYSDAGSATTPKFGFRWKPFDDQFVVHGTYSESFAAPPLYQAYGPYDTRPVTDRLIGIVFGPNYAFGNSFNGEDGANPDLRPSTAKERSIGFRFQPEFIKGLIVSADYSSIDLYDFPGGADFTRVMQSVNDMGSDSPYFDSVSTGNFVNLGGDNAQFATPGALLAFLTDPVTGQPDPTKASQLYVIDRFRNQSQLSERAWSIGLTYILPQTDYGIWTISSNGTLFESYKFQRRPGDAFQQYAGNASNIGVFAGTLPKARFYTTVDWRYQSLDLTLANTYISGVDDAGAAGTLPGISVDSYSAWDLRGTYDWEIGSTAEGRKEKLVLAIGVNNLGDTMPPIFPRAFSNQYVNSDIGTYSPIGRLVYGQLTVEF
jgi:outer membrane receptor protein involved in Fe transport